MSWEEKLEMEVEVVETYDNNHYITTIPTITTVSVLIDVSNDRNTTTVSIITPAPQQKKLEKTCKQQQDSMKWGRGRACKNVFYKSRGSESKFTENSNICITGALNRWD